MRVTLKRPLPVHLFCSLVDKKRSVNTFIFAPILILSIESATEIYHFSPLFAMFRHYKGDWSLIRGDFRNGKFNYALLILMSGFPTSRRNFPLSVFHAKFNLHILAV